MARGGLVALIALAVVGAPGADARDARRGYTPFTADGDVRSRIKTLTRSGSCRLGCLLVLRSERRVHRHRPTHSCGRRGPFLFGRPNRRKRAWTIRIAMTRRGKGLRRARIRVAYR